MVNLHWIVLKWEHLSLYLLNDPRIWNYSVLIKIYINIGLFYYAGHGFKMQESYMLAVNAPESYLRKDAIYESELLAILLQNDPAFLVTILDMCQTVPPK